MGELQRPPNRSELARQLAVNAATKPANVLTPAGVAVAALLLGQVWLLAVAVVVYVVLGAMTFLDAGEAEALAARRGRERIGPPAAWAPEALHPRVRRHAVPARREEQLLREAIAEADLPLADLSAEVDRLAAALATIAGRGQRLCAYLDTQDRRALEHRIGELAAKPGTGPDADREQLGAALSDQLRTLDRMEQLLAKFEAEMEHATATLATMRGQVVEMSITADALGEQRLIEQARDVRDQVGAAAEAMGEIAEQA